VRPTLQHLKTKKDQGVLSRFVRGRVSPLKREISRVPKDCSLTTLPISSTFIVNSVLRTVEKHTDGALRAQSDSADDGG